MLQNWPILHEVEKGRKFKVTHLMLKKELAKSLQQQAMKTVEPNHIPEYPGQKRAINTEPHLWDCTFVSNQRYGPHQEINPEY